MQARSQALNKRAQHTRDDNVTHLGVKIDKTSVRRRRKFFFVWLKKKQQKEKKRLKWKSHHCPFWASRSCEKRPSLCLSCVSRCGATCSCPVVPFGGPRSTRNKKNFAEEGENNKEKKRFYPREEKKSCGRSRNRVLCKWNENKFFFLSLRTMA